MDSRMSTRAHTLAGLVDPPAMLPPPLPRKRRPQHRRHRSRSPNSSSNNTYDDKTGAPTVPRAAETVATEPSTPNTLVQSLIEQNPPPRRPPSRTASPSAAISPTSMPTPRVSNPQVSEVEENSERGQRPVTPRSRGPGSTQSPQCRREVAKALEAAAAATAPASGLIHLPGASVPSTTSAVSSALGVTEAAAAAVAVIHNGAEDSGKRERRRVKHHDPQEDDRHHRSDNSSHGRHRSRTNRTVRLTTTRRVSRERATPGEPTAAAVKAMTSHPSQSTASYRDSCDAHHQHPYTGHDSQGRCIGSTSPSPAPPEGECGRQTPERVCAPGYRPKAATRGGVSNSARFTPMMPTTSSASSTLVPFVSENREEETYFLTRYSKHILAPLDVNRLAQLTSDVRNTDDNGNGCNETIGVATPADDIARCCSPSADRFLSTEATSYGVLYGTGPCGAAGTDDGHLSSRATSGNRTTATTTRGTTATTAARTNTAGDAVSAAAATTGEKRAEDGHARMRREQTLAFMRSRRSCSTLCPTDMDFVFGGRPVNAQGRHRTDGDNGNRQGSMRGGLSRAGPVCGGEREADSWPRASVEDRTMEARERQHGYDGMAHQSIAVVPRIMVSVCVRVHVPSHGVRALPASDPSDCYVSSISRYDNEISKRAADAHCVTVTLADKVDLCAAPCAHVLDQLQKRLHFLLPAAASLDGQLLLTAADNVNLERFFLMPYRTGRVALTPDARLADYFDVMALAEAVGAGMAPPHARPMFTGNLSILSLQWHPRGSVAGRSSATSTSSAAREATATPTTQSRVPAAAASVGARVVAEASPEMTTVRLRAERFFDETPLRSHTDPRAHRWGQSAGVTNVPMVGGSSGRGSSYDMNSAYNAHRQDEGGDESYDVAGSSISQLHTRHRVLNNYRHGHRGPHTYSQASESTEESGRPYNHYQRGGNGMKRQENPIKEEDEADDSVEVIRMSSARAPSASISCSPTFYGQPHSTLFSTPRQQQRQPPQQQFGRQVPPSTVRLVDHLVERCEEASLFAPANSASWMTAVATVVSPQHTSSLPSGSKLAAGNAAASVSPFSSAPSHDTRGAAWGAAVSSSSRRDSQSIDVCRGSAGFMRPSASPSPVINATSGGGARDPYQLYEERITFLFDDGI